MLRHESGDMQLAEDPEIYMDAETRMLRHGSDTWILQRIMRFEDAET